MMHRPDSFDMKKPCLKIIVSRDIIELPVLSQVILCRRGKLMSDQAEDYRQCGMVNDAHDYLNQPDALQNTPIPGNWSSNCSSGIIKGSARLMKGLISLSGLRETEDSPGRLGYDTGSSILAGTILKDGAKTPFDAGVNFIPAGKVLASLSKGKNFYSNAKEGAGMAFNAGKSGCKPVAQQLTDAISKTIPEGGNAAAGSVNDTLDELTDHNIDNKREQ